MNSWIDDSSRCILLCLCTAIIKVHENQVMQYKSMFSYFHAFVLQLSRHIKIRWYIMKYTFIHLYCNYQGTWKSGEDCNYHMKIKCFWISPPDTTVLENWNILEHSAPWVLWTLVWMGSCVSKFDHQVAMYLKIEIF